MTNQLTDGQKRYLDSFDELLADKTRRDNDPKFLNALNRLAVNIVKTTAPTTTTQSTRIPSGTTVTTKCHHPECGQEFTYVRLRADRKYCSRKCADEMQRVATRRSVERKRGNELSATEVLDLMRHAHPRRTHRIADTVDHAHEARECVDEYCITKLCRYNPGPYCFHHAELIAQEVQADHDRKRILELKAMALV